MSELQEMDKSLHTNSFIDMAFSSESVEAESDNARIEGTEQPENQGE